MSLAILISHSEAPSIIVGGSHAMVPLVADVAEHMKNFHPNIYKRAFESLEWAGDVDLSELDEHDFSIVYDASRSSYERFLSDMAASGRDLNGSGVYQMWQEYLKALEADPRFSDGE